MQKSFILLLCALFCCVNPTQAQSPNCHRYVSVQGLASNDGSFASPWSAQHAFYGASGAVKPGMSICLKGGSYAGVGYSVTISGSELAPIVFRPAPGERVIFDAQGREGIVLSVSGSFVTIRGLEITDTSLTPLLSTGLSAVGGKGIKFIHCVAHNLGATGFSAWSESSDFELYGSLAFLNGRNSTRRGYGIYTQNAVGSKLYENNAFFWNFGGYNVHAYTESSYLHNMTYRGNVSLDGIMMVGGTKNVAENLVWENNANYQSGVSPTGSIAYIGYAAGIRNAIFRNNYFPSGVVYWAYANQIQEMRGNIFRGFMYYHHNTPAEVPAADAMRAIPLAFPDNIYGFGAKPPALTGVRVLTLPDRYERGRGMVVVYNFDMHPMLTVDLSAFGLRLGEVFEITDGQAYFEPPILSGRYSGTPVSLPLTLSAVNQPRSIPVSSNSGISSIRHTSREFNFFIVRSSGDLPTAPGNLRVVTAN